MLANILAIAVGTGSFGLYMAAFFFPEVHRKQDFIWSGLGLFYAVVLWFCAGRMTGAVLLGQTASVVLPLALEWQMLTLRRSRTPEILRTPIADDEILPAMGHLAGSAVNAITDLPGLAQVKNFAAEVTKPVAMKPQAPTSEETTPVTPTIKLNRRGPNATTATIRFRYQYEYLEDLPGGDDVLPADMVELELEIPIPNPQRAAEQSEEYALTTDTEASPAEAASTGDQGERAIAAADNTVDMAEVLKIDALESPELALAENADAIVAPTSNDLDATLDADATLNERSENTQAIAEEKSQTMGVQPVEAVTDLEQSNWPEEAIQSPQTAEETNWPDEVITPTGYPTNTNLEETNWPEDSLNIDSERQTPDETAISAASETASNRNIAPATPVSQPKPAELVQPQQVIKPDIKATESPVAKSSRPKPTLLKSAVILKDWVQDWVKSTRKPKQSKPVIKIPPRPPSIPRSDGAQSESTEQSRPIGRSKDAIATAEIIEDDFDDFDDIFGDDDDF